MAMDQQARLDWITKAKDYELPGGPSARSLALWLTGCGYEIGVGEDGVQLKSGDALSAKHRPRWYEGWVWAAVNVQGHSGGDMVPLVAPPTKSGTARAILVGKGWIEDASKAMPYDCTKWVVSRRLTYDGPGELALVLSELLPPPAADADWAAVPVSSNLAGRLDAIEKFAERGLYCDSDATAADLRTLFGVIRTEARNALHVLGRWPRPQADIPEPETGPGPR